MTKNVKIKANDIVYWHDPAISDFKPSDRKKLAKQQYVVDSISEEEAWIYDVDDPMHEVQVLPDELELVPFSVQKVPARVPFSVQEVPARENEAFPGIGKATYAIVHMGEPLSVEGIADELEIRGTHRTRMEKVMTVLTGADPAVLNYVYFVVNGDEEEGDTFRRMFIDPYFLTQKGCQAAVDELNRMYLAKAH